VERLLETHTDPDIPNRSSFDQYSYIFFWDANRNALWEYDKDKQTLNKVEDLRVNDETLSWNAADADTQRRWTYSIDRRTLIMKRYWIMHGKYYTMESNTRGPRSKIKPQPVRGGQI
jgi:hypothetical protein